MDHTRLRSILLLLLTGILWSLGGVFVKTTDADAFSISAVRAMTAAAALFIILRGKPRFTFSRAQIAGAFAYAATVTIFVSATKMTTAANAILLQYSAPIFVVILNRLIFKKRVYRVDILSIAGVAVGLAFLMSGTMTTAVGALGSSLFGDAISLVSGVTLAILMLSLPLDKDGSQVETVLLGNIIASLFGLPFLITRGISLSALPPVMFLGVFQIAIPYAILAKTSKYASALDLTLIPIIEPILNPVWVYAATGEVPPVFTFVGGATLIGVILSRSLYLLKYYSLR